MTEREIGQDINLHHVKRVIEVRSHQAANELLTEGWILHEVYLSQDWRSNFILLSLDEPTCPRCGGPANVEAVDDGESYRSICQQECY